jgi:hypothetical protein
MTLAGFPATEWQTMILGPYGGDPYEWTFPILPFVQGGHTKVFPARATLGPPDPNVDDTLSVINFMDLTGGQGIAIINPSTDLNRFWWGTSDTRWADGWTIGPEAVAARPDVFTGNCTPIGRIGDAVYALWGTDIHQWDPDDGTWSDSLADVGTVVNTDGIVIFNDTAFFPLGSGGYSYIKETASRTLGAITTVAGAAAPTVNDPVPTSNPKVQAFGVHDQKLWALTTEADGHHLTSSTDGLTANWFWFWVPQDEKFLKANKGITPRHLVSWVRPADGAPTLWLVTRRGALMFNDADVRWQEHNVWNVPPHPNWGRAVLGWRPGEALWISTGGGDLLQITSGNVAQTAQGPGGRGDGMPVGRRGDIVSLASDLANMYALTQGDITPGSSTSMVEDTSGADALSLPAPSSAATLIAFTGKGWHPLWETASPDGACTRVVVGDALTDLNTTDYRAFWGVGRDCWSMPCRLTMYSSRQGRERGIDRFATESHIEFGEFSAGAIAMRKLFSHGAIQLRQASAIEYVEFDYRTDADDDATWHTHATLANTPNARTVLPFGLSSDGLWSAGLASYWIKPRIRLIGNGGTTSPTVRALTLAYLPLQQDANHQIFTIPLPVDVDERSGKTREQIHNQLHELLEAHDLDPQFLVMKLGDATYRVVVAGMSHNQIAAQDMVGSIKLNIIQIPTGDSTLIGEE